jgi:N-acyl-D-aspartate/D-glutamate deacylase
VIRGGLLADGLGGDPRPADVAAEGGTIVAVGQINGREAEEIDASGHLVTPGFVDIHTHDDGPATWDTSPTPSSWHGVTTAVMGNCGVGFAPVRPDAHAQLISLMDGVEDIPGALLEEGIDWSWESFGQYLDPLPVDGPQTLGGQALGEPPARRRAGHHIMKDTPRRLRPGVRVTGCRSTA